VAVAQKVRPRWSGFAPFLCIYFSATSVVPFMAVPGHFSDANRAEKTTMSNNSPLNAPANPYPEPPESSSAAAVAAALRGSTDEQGFPPAAAWNLANPIIFNADWQGQNDDPQRQTEVRLL
jgi:hypothetical protein